MKGTSLPSTAQVPAPWQMELWGTQGLQKGQGLRNRVRNGRGRVVVAERKDSRSRMNSRVQQTPKLPHDLMRVPFQNPAVK